MEVMGILTDTLANSWVEALRSALLTPLQGWLVDHPLMAWFVAHPLWAVAAIVVGLLLLAGLWSAIARLTEGFWLALVRFPFVLVGWIFAITSRLLMQGWLPAAKPQAAGEDRLGEIMGRLESLQTEQETLLAEMRQLLDKRP
jgi:urea transporter